MTDLLLPEFKKRSTARSRHVIIDVMDDVPIKGAVLPAFVCGSVATRSEHLLIAENEVKLEQHEFR